MGRQMQTFFHEKQVAIKLEPAALLVFKAATGLYKGKKKAKFFFCKYVHKVYKWAQMRDYFLSMPLTITFKIPK